MTDKISETLLEQNDLLKDQNKLILEQNDILIEQNDLLKKQNTILIKNTFATGAGAIFGLAAIFIALIALIK